LVGVVGFLWLAELANTLEPLLALAGVPGMLSSEINKWSLSGELTQAFAATRPLGGDTGSDPAVPQLAAADFKNDKEVRGNLLEGE
jgi:hypothetical protein